MSLKEAGTVYVQYKDALGMDESSEKRGFIDTIVSVDASYHDYIKYPKCGMAKVPLQAVMPNEKRLEWNPFPMDFIPGQWTNAITQILEKNSLNAKDIDYYIFSQLSDVYNMETLKFQKTITSIILLEKNMAIPVIPVLSFA